MSTIRQQQVIEKIPENTSSKGALLRSAGYAESTARKPSQVLESKGVLALISQSEAMGLSDERCIHAVIRAVDSRQLSVALQAVKFWFSIKYPESKEARDRNTVYMPILGGITRLPDSELYGKKEAETDSVTILATKYGMTEAEIVRRLEQE